MNEKLLMQITDSSHDLAHDITRQDGADLGQTREDRMSISNNWFKTHLKVAGWLHSLYIPSTVTHSDRVLQ